ncbi:peptidase E [uncultured Alistipes sp.]|uniref:Type 1 glutamine amidotransferase-like domain-containing protein n=1 Tax=uncultured Alistipes sp. TaxID=538949 RepID=UPI0025D1FB01|nr:peptidase E [uncultured Alistipes sp.]
MKKRLLIILALFAIPFMQTGCSGDIKTSRPEQTIFVFGGDINLKFIEYTAGLTGKENPKICFVPTASGDNEDNIRYFNYLCSQLPVQPHVLRVWISSESTDTTFEEQLLGMDAIIVGGGNTLNMLGIWQRQGIDAILEKALGNGIVVAGGSAGSICWFESGVSDARPVALSMVEGFGTLRYSHCPHYAQPQRKELYHNLMKENTINTGYACDDLSGIVFRNGKAAEVVTQSDLHNSYFVSLKNGEVVAEKLEPAFLIRKNALPETGYATEVIDKKLSDFPAATDAKSPLNAFILLNQRSFLNNPDTSPERKEKIRNMEIYKIHIYNDLLAGVVNRVSADYCGLWYFYKKDGQWINAGEDIGGNSVYESEITFRERAGIIIKSMANK